MTIDRIYRARHEAGPRFVLERGGTFCWLEGDPFSAYRPGAVIDQPASLRWLAPADPSIVVCIGLNYRDHAEEMGKPLPEEPLVFLKPPTTVIGPEAPILLPAWAGRIEHEAEMAVVIGRTAARVAAADAMQYVLGVTCLCDVTARELQRRDVQYSRAKGFDTFAPLGPCIAVGLDPSNLAIEGRVNGERRHASNTRQLIFSVPHLIEHITRFMTLRPGDVITTGTPSGVGPLLPGDRVSVTVEGVGTLTNPCLAA